MISKFSTTTVKNRRRVSLSSKIDNETLQQRQFYIQLSHCDGEYKSLTDPIRDKLNAEMNFAITGDHVPEAECNNFKIKECITAALHCFAI